MRTLLQFISLAGLLLTLVPSLLYFYAYISADSHKLFMACGMVIWFLSAPFWMNRQTAP